MEQIFNSEEELFDFASKIINIQFGILDKTDRLNNKKGGIGQMVEESYFGYKPNSKSEADFKELGIELKVTPYYKRNKKKTKETYYRAKERLVLNIINFEAETLDNFYDSSLWKKNSKILIMFYEHRNDLDRLFWWIDSLIMFKWPVEDLPIIINDWKIITGKIRNGKAHEISESDTMYLSACTKGATAAKSLRNQPYSEIKAKQRAYSLKPSYMSYILNNFVYGDSVDANITKNFDFGSKKSDIREKLINFNTTTDSFSVHDYIKNTIAPFIGKTQKELVKLLDVTTSKQTNASIINKIFQLNDNIDNTEEFTKANIITKTIRIESNGSIKEHMSFQTFKFNDIIELDWEESEFYELLANTTFLFIIFRKTDNNDGNAIFEGVKFWSMPEEDLEHVSDCYYNLRDILNTGVKLEEKNGKVKNNLPKPKDNKIAHVRPHASKSAYRTKNIIKGNINDADVLPNGDMITKQCFWLNKDYINKILKSIK